MNNTWILFLAQFCDFRSAPFRPNEMTLVRAGSWLDETSGVANKDEGVDSITNINHCPQQPFFPPIYISLKSGGSVNHPALKE